MSKIKLNTEELAAEKEYLAAFLATPAAFNDPDFSKKNKRFSEVQELLDKANLRDTLQQQLLEAKELIGGRDGRQTNKRGTQHERPRQQPKLDQRGHGHGTF